MRIIAFVPDLIDRSRLSGAGEIVFVDSPEALDESEADLVIVDLSRAGVLEVLPRLSVRSVGFASHVDVATIDAARAAGCEAFPRSRFFGSISQLLGEGSECP